MMMVLSLLVEKKIICIFFSIYSAYPIYVSLYTRGACNWSESISSSKTRVYPINATWKIHTYLPSKSMYYQLLCICDQFCEKSLLREWRHEFFVVSKSDWVKAFFKAWFSSKFKPHRIYLTISKLNFVLVT